MGDGPVNGAAVERQRDEGWPPARRFKAMVSSLPPRWRRAWREERALLGRGAAAALLCSVLFLLLTLAIAGDNAVTRLDAQAHARAQALALADQAQRPWMLTAMVWISHVFSTITVVLLLGLLLAVGLHRRPFAVLAIVLTLLPGALLRLALVVLIGRERPPAALIDSPVLDASFPSGHAATTVFFLGWLTWLLFRRLRVTARLLLLVAVALLTVLSGWSRIYLGVHWLSDIIGAWLLAGAWLALVLSGVTALERAGYEREAAGETSSA